MWKAIVSDAESRMKRSIEATQEALSTIRTGVANASLLHAVDVEAYGNKMKIHELATVSVPEVRMIMITPWDKSLCNAIEKAILMSELGITPNNDGSIIRISIPALTQDRRKELAKAVGKKVEEGKIAVRNVRRDANEQVKQLEKKKDISEDECHRAQDEVQKHTDKAIEQLDAIHESKEKEVMQV